MMLLVLWFLWALINLATFILYGVDKRRSKRGAWRIPERTLLAFTWLLGGAGAWLGMTVFRHKTKHLRFAFSAPLATVVSLALMAIATVRLV